MAFVFTDKLTCTHGHRQQVEKGPGACHEKFIKPRNPTVITLLRQQLLVNSFVAPGNACMPGTPCLPALRPMLQTGRSLRECQPRPAGLRHPLEALFGAIWGFTRDCRLQNPALTPLHAKGFSGLKIVFLAGLLLFCISGAFAVTNNSRPVVQIVEVNDRNSVSEFRISINAAAMRANATPRRLVINIRYTYQFEQALRAFVETGPVANRTYTHEHETSYIAGDGDYRQTLDIPPMPAEHHLEASRNHWQLVAVFVQIIPRYIQGVASYQVSNQSDILQFTHGLANFRLSTTGTDYSPAQIPTLSVREDNMATGEPYFILSADTTHITNPPQGGYYFLATIVHTYTLQANNNRFITETVRQSIGVNALNNTTTRVAIRWPNLTDRSHQIEFAAGRLTIVSDRIVLERSGAYRTDPRATAFLDGPDIPDNNRNDDDPNNFRPGSPNSVVPEQQEIFGWFLTGIFDQPGYYNGPGNRRTRMVMPHPEHFNAYMTIDGRELLPVSAGIKNINHFVVQSSLVIRGYINGVPKKVVFTGDPQHYRVSVYRGKTQSYYFPNKFFKNEAQGMRYVKLTLSNNFYHDYRTIRILNSADMVPDVKVKKVHYPLNP